MIRGYNEHELPGFLTKLIFCIPARGSSFPTRCKTIPTKVPFFVPRRLGEMLDSGYLQFASTYSAHPKQDNFDRFSKTVLFRL